MVIYADLLLAHNSLTVIAAYGMTAVAVGQPLRVKRLIFCGILIGLFTTMTDILPISRGIGLCLIPLTAFLGTYLVFGCCPLITHLRLTLGAISSTLLIGGIKLAIANMGISGNTVKSTLFSLAIILALCFIIAGTKKLPYAGRKIAGVTVCRDGRKIYLTALVDTGNELKGKNLESVIVAEASVTSPLFRNPDTDIRLLPCVGLFGEGILKGILCDYAIIDNKKISKVIVAVAPLRLGGGCNALINPQILKLGGNENGF